MAVTAVIGASQSVGRALHRRADSTGLLADAEIRGALEPFSEQVAKGFFKADEHMRNRIEKSGMFWLGRLSGWQSGDVLSIFK